METVETRKISDEIAAALKALEDKRGRLDTADVVEEAASPDSPLHEWFPWDDKQAAHERRLELARTLIRRVRFEVWVEDVKFRPVAYVAVPDVAASRYVSVPRVRSRSEAAAIMEAELARIIGNIRRTADLARVKAALLPPGLAVALDGMRADAEAIAEKCRV